MSASGFDVAFLESKTQPRDETYPKRCRIVRRHEYLRVQGQGQRIHSKHFVFQFLPGRSPESRLGVTVSKKVGNAVVRNQIKRWIRESFRRLIELRPQGRGASYDLVITAKSGVEDFSFAQTEAQIAHALQKFISSPRVKPERRAPRPPRPRLSSSGGREPNAR